MYVRLDLQVAKKLSLGRSGGGLIAQTTSHALGYALILPRNSCC